MRIETSGAGEGGGTPNSSGRSRRTRVRIDCSLICSIPDSTRNGVGDEVGAAQTRMQHVSATVRAGQSSILAERYVYSARVAPHAAHVRRCERARCLASASGSKEQAPAVGTAVGWVVGAAVGVAVGRV